MHRIDQLIEKRFQPRVGADVVTGEQHPIEGAVEMAPRAFEMAQLIFLLAGGEGCLNSFDQDVGGRTDIQQGSRLRADLHGELNRGSFRRQHFQRRPRARLALGGVVATRGEQACQGGGQNENDACCLPLGFHQDPQKQSR